MDEQLERSKMKKAEMIKQIIVTAKASGANPDGDMLFSLAFRTCAELKKICKVLGIKS